MNRSFYSICRLLANFIRVQCIRQVTLHPERTTHPGGCLIACTHISHLEPIIVSAALPRPVRWMARIEFYRSWWGASLLRLGGAFPVDRYGFSLPAVRRAVALLREGHSVGIFPEGGVARGPASILRDGPLKLGVCVASLRSGRPIVPCVVLGTHELNRVAPWLPFRRGRVWLAFGNPIFPPAREPGGNRSQRLELERRLRRGFLETYDTLRTMCDLPGEHVP